MAPSAEITITYNRYTLLIGKNQRPISAPSAHRAENLQQNYDAAEAVGAKAPSTTTMALSSGVPTTVVLCETNNNGQYQHPVGECDRDNLSYLGLWSFASAMSVGCVRGDGCSSRSVFVTRVPSGAMPHALLTGVGDQHQRQARCRRGS